MSEQTKDQMRIVNPTPKMRFMDSNENLSKHRTLVDSKEFQRAEDFAMRQYTIEQMNRVTDANSAAAAGLKLLGAHEFLTTFRLLSEQAKIATIRPVTDNLSEPN